MSCFLIKFSLLCLTSLHIIILMSVSDNSVKTALSFFLGVILSLFSWLFLIENWAWYMKACGHES